MKHTLTLITAVLLIPDVPVWEGLLRLYDVTKEKRFLHSAAFGARMVMTGMWTQPMPSEKPVSHSEPAVSRPMEALFNPTPHPSE
jgi:hypothetical protein